MRITGTCPGAFTCGRRRKFGSDEGRCSQPVINRLCGGRDDSREGRERPHEAGRAGTARALTSGEKSYCREGSIKVKFGRPSGVRPKGWTGLGGSFDRLPSVAVLELRGAQVAER